MVSICATLINAYMKNATRGLESIRARTRQTSVLSILNFGFNLTFLGKTSQHFNNSHIRSCPTNGRYISDIQKVQSEW